MPTTVQQVEALPEGLVTLDTITPKVNLVEPTVEKVVDEKPTETVEKVAVAVPDVEVTTVKEPKTDLFETTKHVIPCSEAFSKLTMEVSISKEKEVTSLQRCFILTLHDYGFDNKQFDSFINCPHMSAIRSRSVWINVSLPGQELEASDLTITKYPTIEELADELVGVLDYFNLPQVVLLGRGIGATICTYFAYKFPGRVFGLMCIEPIVSQASYMESIKFKLAHLSFKRQESKEGKGKKEIDVSAEPIVEGGQIENESFHLQPVDKTLDEKFKHRNSKNLSLLGQALVNRHCLINIIPSLQCDTLVATNKNGQGYSESKKFYRTINDAHRRDFKSLVNSPFIEIESEDGRILEDPSMELALGVQYFLQGIGLLSAMPLRASLSRQSSVQSQINDTVSSAAIVEPEADKPE